MKTLNWQLKYKGFTLIELIITIVIIGVLAAVAIPKFQNLSSDAEQGVAAGVAAALASATSVNYGRSKTPSPVACVSGTSSLAAGTCTYWPMTTCAALSTAASDLVDLPAGYTIGGTATLTTDGNSVSGCTVTKGSVSSTFKAYGA
jgi:MSHA pilin protein MshA